MCRQLQLAVTVTVLALTGCGEKPSESSSAPTSAPSPAGKPAPAAKPKPAPPPVASAPKPEPQRAEREVLLMARSVSGQYTIVELFFATDRKVDSNATLRERFTNERGSLTYGLAKVSVPSGHRMGNVERPFSFLGIEFRENPEKHMVLLAADTMSRGDYFGALKKKLSNQASKKAFIFVHGYNVSFHDAVLRTGQMAADLGFSGVPVFYSWPSQGNLARYTVDENTAIWAEANLRQFFEEFARDSSADEIFVLAHSMGARPATGALRSLLATHPQLMGKFKELIVAAPDIDAEVFVRDIVPGFAKLSGPVTLYANSDDRALLASKAIHGAPRAGDASPLVVASGLETIDATAVDTNFLGHAYFVENRVLLTDISLLIEQRLRANKRPGLHELSHAKMPIWQFRP